VPDEPDEGWNDESTGSEEPAVAHDDIMKRLLNYQRNLREGASPDDAAEAARSAFAAPDPAVTPPATEEVVDLSSAGPSPDVEAVPQHEEDQDQELEMQAEPAPEREVEWEPTTPAQPDFEPSLPIEQASPLMTIPETSAGAAEMTPGSRAELEGRLATLEERLQRLGSRIGELRRSFQDMAIAADERLAAMEDEVGHLRREREGE
jgi:hypothetical protein